jgi:sigma-54 dependent transcriptional regulator, acetoin dehydrogenase operon transcriptional activator AcoR
MLQANSPSADQRLTQIAQSRVSALYDRNPSHQRSTPAWIQRSWQRCLAIGHQPDKAASFDALAPSAWQEAHDASQTLLQVAAPLLMQLGQAISSTRYFAILTDAHGIVVGSYGQIDRSDPRADLITRVGTDLSEHKVATTAIGAALTELEPIWLHRGEHFFESNSVYSCAGAPLFGYQGQCIGMLDLTGIEAVERPEFKHLVAQSARGIENALTIDRIKGTRDILVRLNWPGHTLGDDSDGLVCLNAEGFVTAANQTARHMLPQLAPQHNAAMPIAAGTTHHSADVFAIGFESLFDAARSKADQHILDVPLWSGLRLNALAMQAADLAEHAVPCISAQPAHAEVATRQPLKEIETALIRKAVDDARGNVLQAAKDLGVSRATVYRRLGALLKRR